MKQYGYQVGHDAMLVDARFEICLDDNGEGGDKWVGLKAAPSTTHTDGTVAIYISTNGDPMQVATLDKSGDVIWYIGEDEPEDTEAVTIATCLEGFNDFVGRTPAECAEMCAEMFGAKIDR